MIIVSKRQRDLLNLKFIKNIYKARGVKPL